MVFENQKDFYCSCVGLLVKFRPFSDILKNHLFVFILQLKFNEFSNSWFLLNQILFTCKFSFLMTKIPILNDIIIIIHFSYIAH